LVLYVAEKYPSLLLNISIKAGSESSL